MKIGIPREVKILEGRIALIPDAAGHLVRQGHTVYIERDAGRLSGYTDEDYRRVGVEILPDAASLYQAAQMIVKVKEPQPQEFGYLREDHLLFSYLHLAAEPALTEALLKIGLTGVAFETVQVGRQLPLLAPMSDIAGRIATQIGTHLLYQPQGGRGVLLGGLPAAERGNVVILGAGTGNPYFTTDTAAALRAMEIDAELLVKATKVDGVYSADPFLDPNADRYEKLTYLEVLSRDLKVMDASAISLARENKIPIVVFSIRDSGAFANVVKGEGTFTIISEGA